MPSFYALVGVAPGGFDPEHRFVTSWLLPPRGLAFLRLLFALFCWANLFACFGYDAIHDPGTIGAQFSYFTNLTWWGITCYMTVAAVHTFVYVQKGYSWLDRWWRPLQLLHSFFYTTIVTYPFLVTIVYWVILYKNPWFTVTMDAFRNVSRHGLNSLAALLEIILPATNPPPFLHIPFLVVVLALYLALAYVTYATQGFYTYSFLNPAHGAGLLAGYIVGIAVAGVVIFLIVWGLIWTRRRFTGLGKRSQRDIEINTHRDLTSDVEMTLK
ncbi:Vacuolar protein sorting-associated protein 8 [Neophaeococcomyces mojaviensis]|uniref:Vacuolar protein sorting-associated protein 8 n=1 Tax=Neophaeococcomyces mojaviensis TaxID=3383035 RepID=A0ACC3A486_9EURO|nr:Vacuolar protein sorting-associated protein 8 [Knufia sp. JES_112]